MDMKLTISRRSNDKIVVSITDELSRTKFVEVEVSPHDFAMAVTGLSEVPASGDVRGLANVGKKKVYEKRSVVCPIETYDKKVLVKWLEENGQEDGWSLDSYLGSQSSVVHEDSGNILNYGVYKYVAA